MRTWVVTSLVIALLGAAARADDAAEARKLVEKAIKAHGGAEVISKYPAMVAHGTGTFYGMGQGIEFKAEMQHAPNRSRFEIKFEIMGMRLRQLQVFDGTKGWKLEPGQNDAKAMDKDEIEETKEEMYATHVEELVPLLKDPAFKLALAGEEKVDGKPALGLRVSSAGHKDITLYFDRETGRTVRADRRVQDASTGGKEVSQEAVYSDFKEAKGLLYAGKIAIKRDGEKFVEMTITEFEPHEKLDDSHFGKP